MSPPARLSSRIPSAIAVSQISSPIPSFRMPPPRKSSPRILPPVMVPRMSPFRSVAPNLAASRPVVSVPVAPHRRVHDRSGPHRVGRMRSENHRQRRRSVSGAPNLKSPYINPFDRLKFDRRMHASAIKSRRTDPTAGHSRPREIPKYKD
jgi:hypothetical protein